MKRANNVILVPVCVNKQATNFHSLWSGINTWFDFGVHCPREKPRWWSMHPYWTFSPSPSHPLLCLFCCSHEVVRGLAEAQDEVVKEEGVNYVAMRNLFVRESQESMTLTVEKKTRKTIVRESAESLQLDRKVSPSLLHIRSMGFTVYQSSWFISSVAGLGKLALSWTILDGFRMCYVIMNRFGVLYRIHL